MALSTVKHTGTEAVGQTWVQILPQPSYLCDPGQVTTLQVPSFLNSKKEIVYLPPKLLGKGNKAMYVRFLAQCLAQSRHSTK